MRLKRTQEGDIPERLTNFTAKIAADVAEDDGAEVRRHFEIEAELAGRRQSFTIPSAQFAPMSWVTEHLGASAIIYPGSVVKDHARTAVQMLSGDVAARRVYAHTGWREIDGEWAYLHAGGGIGRVSDIEVGLSGSLAGRALPDEAEIPADVISCLGLWDLAPRRITVPLLGAAFRAALGDSDFSIHLSGPTGEGKSELVGLVQQHFGASLDSRHLASWESTNNALEGQAFVLKDQVMVLDDFAPTGSSYDVQRWHKKADRVLRAKGNASSRQRMRADTTLRPEKPPRALMVSTGEEIPRGQSLRARMLVLELGPGDLDFEKLSECQREAAAGRYAGAMAGFLRWLAPRYANVRDGLGAERAELRDEAATRSQHRRTSGIVADLALGLRYFLRYAEDTGALSADEAQRHWSAGWEALGEAAEAQAAHQAGGEPTGRFRELLIAAIASGRAHVAESNGDEPETPDAWGWRAVVLGTGEFERTEWRPHGDRIGWVEDEDLYLEPEAAFAAAQKQGRDSGEPLAISGRTLRKRLAERGLLAATDEKRGTSTVRRTLGGSRREVLHIPKNFLSPPSDQTDHGVPKAHTYGDPAPDLWSVEANTPLETDQQTDQGTDHQKALTYGEKPTNGQFGQFPNTRGGPKDISHTTPPPPRARAVAPAPSRVDHHRGPEVPRRRRARTPAEASGVQRGRQLSRQRAPLGRGAALRPGASGGVGIVSDKKLWSHEYRRALPHEKAIVWEEDISRLAYVRESVILTYSRSRPPLSDGRRIGYALLKKSAPNSGAPSAFYRRVFWLAEHDYDSGGNCYSATSGPMEAVNPRRAYAGVGSRRGDLSEPDVAARALYLELAAIGCDLRTGEALRTLTDIGLLERVRAHREALRELQTDEDEPDIRAIRAEGSVTWT